MLMWDDKHTHTHTDDGPDLFPHSDGQDPVFYHIHTHRHTVLQIILSTLFSCTCMNTSYYNQCLDMRLQPKCGLNLEEFI